jgi:uncharacterized protein YcbK (DUF882 family)
VLEMLPYKNKKTSSIAYIKSESDKKKIDKYIKKEERKYKYFSAKEVEGLNPEFVKVLDKIRGELKRPIIINSGKRSEAENKKLGGAKNSFHVSGNAVDIKRLDGRFAYDLVLFAIANGIYGIEIATNHIHLDFRLRELRSIFYGKSK